MTTTTSKLTLEAFLKRRDTKPASEYWDGKVTRKPMPNLGHGLIQHLLAVAFWLYLREHPIGVCGSEIRCIMQRGGGPWAPVPDYCFITYERLGATPLDESIQGAPDLVVEILSPRDNRSDAIDKVRAYLDNGARLGWLMDPRQRTILVLSGANEQRLLTEHDTLDGGDVLPGLRVPVRSLFPDLAARPATAG